MKNLLAGITLLLVMSGCSNNRSNPAQQPVNVTIQSNTSSDFDVNKLGELVKTSRDPATLEKSINDDSNDINNLDLDHDGKVDYLKVVENGNNKLDVVDDVSKDQSVTVASINITPQQASNTADMSIAGNPTYCGPSYSYHSSFGFTDFLLLSYLLRPHPYYVPMYHYGYYPSYYAPRTRIVRTYRSSGGSYNNGGSHSSSSYNRRSLSDPSHSQRSFSTRDVSRPVLSGGFGSSRSSGSRSSFGSSRSGFGRRR